MANEQLQIFKPGKIHEFFKLESMKHFNTKDLRKKKKKKEIKNNPSTFPTETPLIHFV